MSFFFTAFFLFFSKEFQIDIVLVYYITFIKFVRGTASSVEHREDSVTVLFHLNLSLVLII